MLKSKIEGLAISVLSMVITVTTNSSNAVTASANSLTVLDSTIEEKDKRYDKYIDKIACCIDTTSDYKSYEESINLANVMDKTLVDLEADYEFKRDVPRLLAIISTESDFRNLLANEAEAVGYMQITPQCLSYVNKKMHWEYSMDDMIIPEANIKVGWAKYNLDADGLSEDEATVAYNQGYRNLKGAVQASYGDRNSYLSKINSRIAKYRKMMEE